MLVHCQAENYRTEFLRIIFRSVRHGFFRTRGKDRSNIVLITFIIISSLFTLLFILSETLRYRCLNESTMKIYIQYFGPIVFQKRLKRNLPSQENVYTTNCTDVAYDYFP